MLRLSSDILRLGAVWRGARGSGKTLGLSRATIVPLFLGGATVVALDPLGALATDVLWCLTRLDPKRYPNIWDRVVYAPLGGYADHVLSTPFLSQRGEEDLESRAQRPISLWLRLSPELERAPLLGAGKLRTVGRDVLMLAEAMGLELVDVEDLLLHPDRYRERAERARRAHPWALEGPAEWYLETYSKLAAKQRDMEVGALLSRVTPYARSEGLAAQYGGDGWDVPLERIAERGQRLILLDGRHLAGDDERRTAIAWLFRQVLEVVGGLGPSRAAPVFLVIDELAVLIGQGNPLLEDDFDRLVQIGRNYSVGSIVGYQEYNQLSVRMNNILGQLGCQFYSSTTDEDAAEDLARRFDPYSPFWVKETRPMFAQDQARNPYVIHEVPVYFSVQEQLEMAKRRYMKQPKLRFLAGISPKEGEPPTSLRTINLEPFARYWGWPEQGCVDEARRRLVMAHGRPIEDVLDAIRRRRNGAEQKPEARAPDRNGVVPLDQRQERTHEPSFHPNAAPVDERPTPSRRVKVSEEW
jgi:hypothetical protein